MSPAAAKAPSSAGSEGAMLLFVYGTLQPSEPAHELLAGARCLGPARTQPRYTLRSMGEWPALCAGGTTSVVGTLYVVPAAQLPALDAYEECPHVFVRAPVALEQGIAAQAYFDATGASDEVAPPIVSGDWQRR